MSRFNAACFALGVAVVGVFVADYTASSPFDQQSFPCEEDQVLGYSPAFGPDLVGCIQLRTYR